MPAVHTLVSSASSHSYRNGFVVCLLHDTYIPGEPKKIPPMTFVDITAMHGNFCTKFYTIVKRSNVHFITKFY